MNPVWTGTGMGIGNLTHTQLPLEDCTMKASSMLLFLMQSPRDFAYVRVGGQRRLVRIAYWESAYSQASGMT